MKDDSKPRARLTLADLSAMRCLGYPVNHDHACRTARRQ
jgi:hypothetical protein